MDDALPAANDLPLERLQMIREKAARFLRPMPEEDDLSYWQHASLQEKGKVLADLLNLVDAIGHYPPKREQFRWSPRPGSYPCTEDS